jgi:phage terminase large subunit-like protein
MIGAYLNELESELRLPGRLRRRVLAEAADHLHEATDAYVAEGMSRADAEWAAVAAFGPARGLARRFAEELATRSVSRAGWGACAAAIAFGLFFGVTARGGPVAFFAVQVAFVAGLATLIRLLRHHGELAVPAAELRLIQRGSTLALGCAAVGLAAGPSPAAGAVAAAVLVAAVVVARAQPRAVAVRAFAEQPPEDIVEDIRALAARYGLRLPRVPLDWRAAALVAVVCGLFAAAGHAQEYTGGAITWRAFLASAIIVWAEALMVLFGYALFGRWLGINAAPSAARRRA